jgi:hypothetical protein
MTKADKAALELAMKIASRDRARAQQLKDMLDGDKFNPPRPWEEVAKFAASCCQMDALNLKPWERPPCHPGIDPLRGDGSIKLRERMDAAGISPWHPSPMAALQAKRKPA